MISEKEISAGFHSFWSELLPLLTPACVTLINRSYGQYLRGCRPVDAALRINQGDLKEQDLLAEVSFEAFKMAHEAEVSATEILRDPVSAEAAWVSASARIGRHRRLSSAHFPASDELSFHYIESVCMRYEALRDQRPGSKLEISPRLRGCGMLGVCEADLSIGSELIEVKTVARNFSSKDIRQLVLYLALDAISGCGRWSSGVLFNPRRAWHVTFDPKTLLEYVSAGKTSLEVYRSIETFLLSREFVSEQQF